MELRNTLKHKLGFTLIETVIAIMIISCIFSLGLFFSFDFYRNFSLSMEKESIANALRKARNRSLYNLGQAPHGVRLSENPLLYTIFKCQSEDSACSKSEEEDIRNAAFQASFIPPTPAIPFAIIFEQLSGNCRSCQGKTITIRVSNHKKSYDITINAEGQIES